MAAALVACFGVWLCPGLPAWADEPPLTVARACLDAQEASLEVQRSRLEAHAAACRVRQARSRLAPTASLTQRLIRTDDPVLTGGIRFAHDDPAFFEEGPVTDWQPLLSLDYVLFDGGARTNGVRASAQELTAQREGLREVRGRVAATVAGLVMELVSTERITAVLAEELKRMEGLLAVARSRGEGGRSLASAVAAAAVRVEEVRHELASQEEEALNLREELGRLLGRPVPETVAEGEENPLLRAVAFAGPERAADEALRSSPVLAARRARAAAAHAEARSRRGALAPSVVAGVVYGGHEDRPGPASSDRDFVQAEMRLSWAAFDGGARRSRVDEARALADAADVALRDAEGAVAVQARAAARAVTEAMRGIEVSRRQEEAEAVAAAEAETAFRAGRGGPAAVLASRSRLAAARVAVLRGDVVLARRCASLLQTVGFWGSWTQGGGAATIGTTAAGGAAASEVERGS